MSNPVRHVLQIITLALWLTCALGAVTGLGVGWPGLVERKPDAPAVTAELIDTDLQQGPAPDEPAAPPEAVPPEQAPVPPPMQDLPDLPPLPELPAFVEKAMPPPPPQPKRETPPAKPREKTQSSRPAVASSGGTPAPQTLAAGQGGGYQPAPAYPREALERRQEGTVTVQMLVGTDGHVISAEVWQECPWPLLNAAALGIVRRSYKFPPGPVRLYRKPFHFRLQH